MFRTHLHANLADDPREAAMAQAGQDRYRDKQDRLTRAGTVAERDDYASVIQRSLLGVAETIQGMIEKEGEKKRGRKSPLVLKLAALEPVTVAYIALSATFSALTKEDNKTAVAAKIGRLIEDEFNFDFIAEQDPELWRRLKRKAEEKGTYRHKRNFVLNTAAKQDIQPEDWPVADVIKIGTVLLNILVEHELVEIIMETGDYTPGSVRLSPKVIGWLEEHRQRTEKGGMVMPVFAPMTTVPVDWTGPYGAGYRRLKFPLVKAGKADYRSADMSRVYAAINTMQRTAWHINPEMLRVVEQLWAIGEEVGKLPECKQREVPPKISKEDWAQMEEDEQKAWRLQLRDIHDNNRKATSNLISITQVIAQARELRHEDAIYIPYQLDYRGRVYAVPLMNPQGPDYIRALFEFSEGKPVGERGAMWIAIQVASLWDGPEKLSKASFQERYEWVENNEEMLREIAADPLNDRRWMDADKPFMFLRTVLDWVRVLEEGHGFVSALPIALDGSCSGIQHYSALLRDPVGGASVNLLPAGRPADVYSDVADVVREQVEADEACPARNFWLSHGITRKVLKKPVMTYGYSSREAGFTDWYENEFVKPARGRQPDNNQFARYLARHTLAAVEVQLAAVARGMEWMIECARLLAHEGKGIEWTAPTGFPVVQCYTKTESVRVETELLGVRLRVSVPGATKTIHKEKQKNAISPNHTHSLDAAHLMLTVLKCRDTYGLTNFALIHDSFGTLPADTDAMFSAVREAFVEMYTEHDPFAHLYDRVHAALSEEGRKQLPVPPEKGTLDLSEVQQSLYSFA